MSTTVFDPAKFKESTRQQWQAAAKAWNDWGVFLRQWLGPATEQMLDVAHVVEGSRVLDVAAGAGDQSLLIAERVGAKGHVLATDISSNILEYARENAQRAGVKNVETRVLDGEDLKLPDDSFDAIVCRLGLMYFPHREKALAGFHRVLKKDGRVDWSCSLLLKITAFSRVLFPLFVAVPVFRHQLQDSPVHSVWPAHESLRIC